MAEIQDGRYSSGLYKKGMPHMFGCPLYMHNTKKACFVRLRGCPYAPHIWMPQMFGCPLYVWMPPYASLYVWVPPMFG